MLFGKLMCVAAGAVVLAAGKGCDSSPGVSRTNVYQNGEYRVGVQISPGSYHTAGRGRKVCTWVVYQPGRPWNGAYAGPVTIHISSAARAVQFAGGCEWKRTG